MALAGGGIQGGRVVGATSPTPDLEAKDKTINVENPVGVSDVHATVLQALGIDFREELYTPIGRPMVISDGEPLGQLLS